MTIRTKTDTYTLTSERAESIVKQIKHFKKISEVLDERLVSALDENKSITETELIKRLTRDFGFNSLRQTGYWEVRGYSKQEAKTEVQHRQKCCSPRCLEYYIIKGIPEDIAAAEIKKIQATATIVHSMSKHGPIAGFIKYNPKKYTSTVEDTSVYDSSDLSFFVKKYGDNALQEQKKFFKSRARSGANNAQYGQPAPKGSGHGVSGYYKGHYFRSTLELRFLIEHISKKISFIDNDVSKNKLDNKVVIQYYDQALAKNRNYIPDYQIGKKVIEVKPSGLIKHNRIKFKAAEDYCRKNNREFVIVAEHDLPELTKSDLAHPELIIDAGKVERFSRIKIKGK